MMPVALDPDTVLGALVRAGGNVTRTALALGVDRLRVVRLLEKHGIDARRVRNFEPVEIGPAREVPPRVRVSRARVLAPGEEPRKRGRPRTRPLAPGEEPRKRGRPRTRPTVRVGAACELRPASVRGIGAASTLGPLGPRGAFEVDVVLVRDVSIDTEIQSVNSYKEHWGQRERRRAKVHRIMRDALGTTAWTAPALPEGWRWRITIWRYGCFGLDSDNFIASVKAHVDALADILGFKNDRDPRLIFRFAQAKHRERGMVRRWDRATKKHALVPGFRCFFRVRIEQVKDSI
jgi:hypothetical protein